MDNALHYDLIADTTRIITHANCPDGMASALLLKDVFPEAKVEFIQYGTEAYKTLPATRGMLFCDISPPPDRVDEFVNVGAVVLDHHKSAKPVVERFGHTGFFADEKDEPGVCGAVLAFRLVWKDYGGKADMAFVENFAKLAGIRDTWQKNDPLWKEACAQASTLMFLPNDLLLSKGLATLAQEWEQDYAWIGRMQETKREKDVLKMIEKGYPFTTGDGTKVIIFPTTHLTSDVCEALGDKADLVIGFGFTNEAAKGRPELILSTRSFTNFDCGAFCFAHGGGGHSPAAGCSFLIQEGDPNPYTYIEQVVRAYAGSRPA